MKGRVSPFFISSPFFGGGDLFIFFFLGAFLFFEASLFIGKNPSFLKKKALFI
jgi:hypothetical protein